MQKEFYMHISTLSSSDKNKGLWIRKFVKYLVKLIKIRSFDFTIMETSKQHIKFLEFFEDVKLFLTNLY